MKKSKNQMNNPGIMIWKRTGMQSFCLIISFLSQVDSLYLLLIYILNYFFVAYCYLFQICMI